MSKKRAEAKVRSLDDVFADLQRYDEVKQEARERILAEVDDLDRRKRELLDKLVDLGFTEFAASEESDQPRRRGRKPISDEHRQKLKEAAKRRWAQQKSA